MSHFNRNRPIKKLEPLSNNQQLQQQQPQVKQQQQKATTNHQTNQSSRSYAAMGRTGPTPTANASSNRNPTVPNVTTTTSTATSTTNTHSSKPSLITRSLSQHSQHRRTQTAVSDTSEDGSVNDSDEELDSERLNSQPDQINHGGEAEEDEDADVDAQNEEDEGDLDTDVIDADGDAEPIPREEKKNDASTGAAMSASHAVATTATVPPAIFPLDQPAEIAAYSSYHALWLELLPELFGPDQFQAAMNQLTTIAPMEETTQGSRRQDWKEVAKGLGLVPTVDEQELESTTTSHSTPDDTIRLSTYNQLINCAKYLIQNQLRSHHGAALPTLTYLDKILTSNFKSRPVEDEPGAAPNSASSSATPQSTIFVSRYPLQHILFFLDAFEKLISHAALGSTILPGPSTPAAIKARDFFSANLQACTTFFSRIRSKLVQASILADLPTNTIYHNQIHLATTLQSLVHVWSHQPALVAPVTPTLLTPAAAVSVAPALNVVPVRPSILLTHADLIAHRQLLGAIQELSQAYLQLRHPASIAGLNHMLQSEELILSTVTPSQPTNSPHSFSLASLCFFLHANELQAHGYYELAIVEYKRVLHLASSLTPVPVPSSSTAPSTSTTLYLPNSIALQACVHGLTGCYLHLCDFEGMEVDMTWCRELSRRWEEILQAIKAVCPIVLHPLLPNTQTVTEMLRWPIEPAYLQALKSIDQTITKRPTLTSLTAEEIQQLATCTNELRETLLQSMKPKDQRSPYLVLTAEQQANMSDELLLLSLTQRLTQIDNATASVSSDGVHLSSAQSLTSWKHSLTLSESLIDHRAPLTTPGGFLVSMTTFNQPNRLDSIVHQQYSTLITNEQIQPVLPFIDTLVSQSPINTLLSSKQFHQFHRIESLMVHVLNSLKTPISNEQHQRLLTSTQQALHTHNLRLVSSLLPQLARVPISDAIDRTALLCAISCLQTDDADSPVTGAKLLKKLAGSHWNLDAEPVTLIRFAYKLQPPSLNLSSPSTTTAAASPVKITNTPKIIHVSNTILQPTAVNNFTSISYLSACYLLEMCEISSYSSMLASFSDHLPTLLPESHRSALIVLRNALQVHPGSAHLWYKHGRLYFTHILQLTNLPPTYAHHFLTEPKETANNATTEESKTNTAASSTSSKKKKHHTSNATNVADSIPIGGEEANRGEKDEDYKVLSLLQMPGTGGVTSPALALLTAIIHAINTVVEGNATDSTPPTTIRSPNSSIPLPVLFPSPNLSWPLQRWFHRLHPVLWPAIATVLPQFIHGSSLETGYLSVLMIACHRVTRIISYAESALHAFIQAQSFIATQSTGQGVHSSYGSSHPSIGEAEIPLNLLTILTRFGSELEPSLIFRPYLSLPPSTFLSTFPQLFARANHAHPTIRALIHALIALIGESYPHQIVFPLCVALHEEEEYRRDADRLATLTGVPSTATPNHPITPKHEMILRIVSVIDQRAVSAAVRQPSQVLHLEIVNLFMTSFGAGRDLSTRSTFFSLLSSVHRIIVELNRVAFLWDDSFLWEFRRIQSDMEVGISGGVVVPVGSRAKMLQEEVDRIMYEAKQPATAATTPSKPDPFDPRLKHDPKYIKWKTRQLQKEQQQQVVIPDQQSTRNEVTHGKTLYDPVAAATAKTNAALALQRLQTSYAAIIAPMMFQIHELQQVTLQAKPTTPHEAKFQKKYASSINALITAIESPTNEQLHKPIQLLWPNLHAKINHLRKQMTKLTYLRMKYISPFLTRWFANMNQVVTSAAPATLADVFQPSTLARGVSDPPTIAATHMYSWYTNISASKAPLVFLTGMQGTDDLYEHARPYPDTSAEAGGSTHFTYLQSFYGRVDILRTKTRPKKLSFAGSDGRMYTYLLKNREDLHLDQRMMQILQQTNRSLYQQFRTCHQHHPTITCLRHRRQLSTPDEPSSIAGTHVCHTTSTPLYARTFAVIPLSDKSGLIKWIDGVSSVFDLYKQEEARKKDRDEKAKLAASAALKQQQRGHLVLPKKEPVPVSNMKSTDVFTHKLTSHLEAAGLRRSTSRKDIPLHILVAVYKEMLIESQKDSSSLLQRELWLSSISPDEVYTKQLNYIHSLAVMSIIGYVIGLGDRHLGNIMIHLGRGDLLHIDYNISLERGLKLPIPEVIPFRLTPILTQGCGVNQFEIERGTFYQTCCMTLSAMRQSEQLLTGLLSHTLITQPLAEWKSVASKPLIHHRKHMDLMLRTQLSTRNSPSHPSPPSTSPSSILTNPLSVIREDRNRHGLHAIRRIQQKLCGIETVWNGVNLVCAPLARSSTTGSHSASVANSNSNSNDSPAAATPSLQPVILPISTQVQRLIHEATKVENLARLYEGWAPWI